MKPWIKKGLTCLAGALGTTLGYLQNPLGGTPLILAVVSSGCVVGLLTLFADEIFP